MNARLIHLRIKIKSLAAEARIIRQEAKRTREMVKWELNHHRTTVVRTVARTNLLAYGLLRGRPYASMEQKCHELPNFDEVGKTAKRFGASEDDVIRWVEEAKAYLKQDKKAA